MLDDIQEQFGLVKLVFNRPPRNLQIDYADVNQEVIYDYEKDTLRLWYSVDGTAPWSLYVQQDTVLNDTILVEPPPKEEFLSNTSLQLLKGRGGKINPYKELVMAFNHPLASFDTSFLQLYEDTTNTKVDPVYTIDTLTRKTLTLQYQWKEGLEYELNLMPGGVTDIYGVSNDTMLLNYTADLRKNYGNLQLTIDGLNPDTNYVIKLFLKETEIQEFQVAGDTVFQQQVRALAPGNYNLRIITDLNKNGRWDSGRYDLMQQPEPIFLKELEQLRANWDLDAEVTVGEGPVVIPTEEAEPASPGGG